MNTKLRNVKLKVYSFIINYKSVVILLIVIYTIALFPLFRANFNYRDDAGRVLWAYDDWKNFGRVTTNTLAHILHVDQYLRDISPLTQIIALLIMVTASLMLLKIVREDKKITVWDAVCAIPLGLFPYFMCCFSYKYDSPYMALSVLFSVLPLMVRRRGKIYYFVAFICSLLMCTTYQASAGIFPMLVVFTAFLDWKNGKDFKRTLYYCLFSAIAFIAAMLIFFVIVPKGNSGYVTEKVSFNQLSIKHIIENYLIYIKTFKSDFRIKWFAVIAVISAIFVIRNTMITNRKKICTFFMSVFVYVLTFAFSLGAYPFLDEPFLMPRGMYGICTFITLICLGATQTGKIEKYSVIGKTAAQICVVVLSWMCIVFSCTYGNALAAQKNYDDFRIREVAEELADFQVFEENEPVTIQIIGNVGYAAGIKNIPGDGILLRLVPPPFGGDNYWSYMKLLSYYGLPEMEYSDELSNEEYTTWDILHENCYHVIYSKDESVIVELK